MYQKYSSLIPQSSRRSAGTMTNISEVAIVTGGAQGIGASICIALLKQRYKVCVADIQEVKGKQFVEEQQATFGSENVIFSKCDVTKEKDYERTFDVTLRAFQKIDIVINNAGIIMEKDPRATLEVNLIGPIFGCQTALKYMGKSNGGKGGLVINTSAIVGFMPFSAFPTYAASKHGVIGLTRSYGLPYHFDKDGIIFAALCPSLTDTDLLKRMNTNTLIPGTDFYHRTDILKPDYVAQGVIKILEDKINGSTLLVTDKGYHYIGFQNEFNGTTLE